MLIMLDLIALVTKRPSAVCFIRAVRQGLGYEPGTEPGRNWTVEGGRGGISWPISPLSQYIQNDSLASSFRTRFFRGVQSRQ